MIQKIGFLIVIAAFVLGWAPVIGNLIHGLPEMNGIILPMLFLVTILVFATTSRAQSR